MRKDFAYYAARFAKAAHHAKRYLYGHRARSNKTGNVGIITDGSIDFLNGQIDHALTLTTPQGKEVGLRLEDLVILDVEGDGTAAIPAIASSSETGV